MATKGWTVKRGQRLPRLDSRTDVWPVSFSTGLLNVRYTVGLRIELRAGKRGAKTAIPDQPLRDRERKHPST